MNKTKLNINQWAKEDRPREKMMLHGVSALSDAELLAILIGSGNCDESAVELMRRVMKNCQNNLNELGKLTVEDLCEYKGIGEAKAITILAASELGKRRKNSSPQERFVIRCSKDIYQHFYPIMCDLAVEECWALMLNQANKVISTYQISTGGLNSALVDVRCLLREALLRRATSVAVCHNHPSGNIRPSMDDDRLTERIRKSCQMIDIRFLDHLVLADGAFYSYADDGKL
jgi:DNA repair protein RadC